jgi:hypothetical protein
MLSVTVLSFRTVLAREFGARKVKK